MPVGARALTEAIVPAAISLLAIFTAFRHDWIEMFFGIDPDAGTGSLEWAFVLVPAAIAVTSAAVAYRKWNRARVTYSRG